MSSDTRTTLITAEWLYNTLREMNVNAQSIPQDAVFYPGSEPLTSPDHILINGRVPLVSLADRINSLLDTR